MSISNFCCIGCNILKKTNVDKNLRNFLPKVNISNSFGEIDVQNWSIYA